MTSTQTITPEQEKALADLLAEVDAASEVVLKRDVLGRVPGFYAGLASGTGELPPHLEYPGGKGGKRRKQRGGAACDNWVVNLAVDSAIVLAGAAAVVGTSYVGIKALSYYMTIYGIPEATVTIITTVYETLITLLTESVPALASGAASGVSSVLSGLYSVTSALMPVAKPGLPAVGIYRYFVQGVSASNDAARIAASVSDKIQNTKMFVDRVTTRSMARKRELQASIAAKSQEVRDALRQARDTASAQAFHTMNRASNLKEIVCDIIDGVASGAIKLGNVASTIKRSIAALSIAAGAGAAAVHLDDSDSGEESPRADDASLPASHVVSPVVSPVAVPSPAPLDVASPAPLASPGSVDQDATGAMIAQLFGNKGGKHGKRTMHKRSKKHHKGKKSRKHMHRRR